MRKLGLRRLPSLAVLGGGAIDPAAAALFAVMSPAPTGVERVAINRLVTQLKSAGIWATIDRAYVRRAAGGLDPHNIVDPTGETFTEVAHASGPYFLTGYSPAADAVNMSTVSGHEAAFTCNVRVSADKIAGGAGVTGNSYFLGLFPYYNGDVVRFYYNSTVKAVNSIGSRGFCAWSRTGATTGLLYGGSDLTPTASTSTENALPNVEMAIRARNTSGSFSSINNDDLAIFSVGGKLTSDQLLAFGSIANEYAYSIGAVPRPAILGYDGNSLVYGVGSTGNPTGNANFPFVCSKSLRAAGHNVVLHNAGVGGQTTAQMLADTTDINRALTAYGRKILIAWELRNSMYVAGRTAAQAVDDLEAYCEAQRADGWEKIIVLNTIPSGSGTFANTWVDGAWNTVNTELDGRWEDFADYLVDLRTVAELQDPTNATYFDPDLTHLEDPGYAAVAGAVEPVVASAIAA